MPQNTRLFLIVLFLFSVFGISSYAQGVKVTFTPRSPLAFGNVVAGKTKDMVIMVKNDATSTALLTCTVTGPTRTDFSIVGQSTFGVNVGDSFSLVIHFAPTAILNYTDTIYITHNGDTTFTTKNPQRIRLTGTGTGTASDTFPKISVSAGFGLNFNSVDIGKTVTKTFTIKNVTDTSRKLTGNVSSPSSSRYSVISGGGIFSLDSGMTQTVTVAFTPDTTGFIFDSLFVTSNAASPNNKIRVNFFGLGQKASSFPKISITPPGGVNFRTDTIGKGAKTATLTIRNISDSLRTLTGNIQSLNSPFSIVSGGGSFSLDSGKTSSLQLAFTATNAGTFHDTLVITSNSDSANQLIRIPLVGVGYEFSGPHISVKPTFLNFGTPNFGSGNISLSSTIKNLSDSLSDTLTSTVSSPHRPFIISSGGGSFTLIHSDSLHVAVQMSTDTTGMFQDSIVVNSNSNDNLTRVVIRLSGSIQFIGAVDGSSSSKINYMTAMPNPFTNKVSVNFSLDKQEAVSMRVYDLLGKEVYSSSEKVFAPGDQEIWWNAAGFKNGTYLCVLTIGKQTHSIRIMLNK